MITKILCPNVEVHNDHDKILLAYDPDRKRFWVPCGGCRRWVRIDINEQKGVTAKILPKNEHLNLKVAATLTETGT